MIMLNRYWLLAAWSCSLPAIAETGKPILQPTSALSTENTMQMLGGLVLVLIVILGLAWILKRFSLVPGTANGTMKLVAATGVGQRERVVIVEINGTWLVLGVAPGRVNMLHSMEKPATNSQQHDAPEPEAADFATQFNDSIRKNNV